MTDVDKYKQQLLDSLEQEFLKNKDIWVNEEDQTYQKFLSEGVCIGLLLSLHMIKNNLSSTRSDEYVH